MAVGIVEYLIKNYNVDPYRIYVHGLSNGAKGVWDIVAKRPDLFAAMLPMSGVGTDMGAMTDTLVTTPIWLFQGGQDTNPSQGYANQWISTLKSKGGNPRYTVYQDLGHGVWNTAYAEPDFFSWMKSKHKKNIYVFGGRTSLDSIPEIKLGFSAGFASYQWVLNGVEIPGANSRYFTANEPGMYGVRFVRKTDGVSDESFPVTLTKTPSNVVAQDPAIEIHKTIPTAPDSTGSHGGGGSIIVYPNPFQNYLYVQFKDENTGPQIITVSDQSTGVELMRFEERQYDTEIVLDLSALKAGQYILTVGKRKFRIAKKH